MNDGTTALNSAQVHQISQAFPPSQASQAQQQIISISDSSDDEDGRGNTASNRIAQNLVSGARPASSGVATPPIHLRQGQIHRLEASLVTKARKAIAHSRKPPSDNTEDPKCPVKISVSYQYVGSGSAESANAPGGEGRKMTSIMLDHLEFCDPRRAERASEAHHAASYDYSQLSATNAVSEPSRNLPPMRISNTESSMPIPPVPNTRLDADDAMDTDDPPFGLRMPGPKRRRLLDESDSKSRDKGKERAVSPQEETSHSNTAVPSRKGKERAATLSPAVRPIAKRAQYFTDSESLGQPVLAADRVEPAEAVGQRAQALEPVVRVVDVDTSQPGPAVSLTSKQHQTKDALVEYAAEALRMQSADLREEYEGQNEQETLLLKCSYCIAAKALVDRGWGIGAHVMATGDGIGRSVSRTHKKHHKTCKHPQLLGADPYHTDTKATAPADNPIWRTLSLHGSSTQDSTTSQDVIEATPDPPVQSNTSYGTGTTSPASTSAGSSKPSLGAMSSSERDSLPPVSRLSRPTYNASPTRSRSPIKPLVPLGTGAYACAPSIGASFETLPNFLAAIDAHSSQVNLEAILTMGKGDADKFREYCTRPTCTYFFTYEQDSGGFEVTEVQPEHCVECMQAGSSIHIRTPPISAPNTRTGAFSLSTNNSTGSLAQNVFPPVPSASASQPNQADRTSRTEQSRRSTPRVSTLFNAPRVGSVFDAADELERAIKAYSIGVHPLGRITASHDATGWTWSCKTSDCRFSFHAAYLSVIEGSVRVDLTHPHHDRHRLDRKPSEDAPKVGNLFGDLEALQQRMFEHTERVNPGSSAGLRDFKAAVTQHSESVNSGSSLNWKKTATYIRCECKNYHAGCRYEFHAAYYIDKELGNKRRLSVTDAVISHSTKCGQELMISGKKKMSSRPDERRRLRTRSSAAAFGTSASDADASSADVAPEAAPQPPRKKHTPNSASKSKVTAKALASIYCH
ncbi:hypothetical protein EMMF5_005946 [Cystobasidiomycetes sp. EMM_F5]